MSLIFLGWTIFSVFLAFFVSNWIDVGAINWEAFWWTLGAGWFSILIEYLFEFDHYRMGFE